MFSFNFLGKNSYNDFGIVIEKRPIIPKPQRNIEYFDVPGRSGSLKVDDETYKDIIIPVQCGFKDNTSVAVHADLIKPWLDGGEGQLIFSNQTDKYYIAHVSDQVDISQEFNVFGKFLVNFRCQPFKYAILNTPVTLTEAGTVINPGNICSDPIILVTGSGTITLTINSVGIQLADISDYVTIDSVLKDSYKDTTLKNSKMTGDFPVLLPGNNTVSWSGTVTSVEIIGNWRWL